MDQPKPPSRLHTAQLLVGTIAGIISIIGGVYSLKSTFSQKGETFGQITGSVRDERLARPLRLATVEVLDDEGNVIGTLSTDDEGLYSLKGLREGTYEVKASAPLHHPDEKRVGIQKNATLTLDFSLVPGETAEERPSPVSIPPAVPTYLPQERPAHSRSFFYDRPRYPTDDPGQKALPDSQEEVTSRQPTNQELLVNAGAALLEQMFQKKTQKRTPAY